MKSTAGACHTRRVRVLICPDKFAGTLSAPEVAEAVADGWAQPDELVRRPLSDGGPGFVEVLAGTVQPRALLADLCATDGYRCYALSRQGLVELDAERLATVRLMDEYGCQDVILSAADMPLR